jgi:hypothetical protein
MQLLLASAFVSLTALAPLACAQIPDADKTGRVIKGSGWTSPATVGAIISGVTLFYREPANTRSSVVLAVLVFSSKVRCATPAEVEATTIWARTANFDKPVPFHQ